MVKFLKILNPIEREKNVYLNQRKHNYSVNGKRDYISVTSWIYTFIEKFNEDLVISNMMCSSKWKDNKYYGKPKSEIKKIWKINRMNAATAGTKMHSDIEKFYNQEKNNNNSIEYSYFIRFNEDNKHLKPWRSELTVYDEDVKIVGTIDMIFENKDGTVDIYDWKRNKEIVKENRYKKYFIKEELKHLPDTNYWQYALQLNIYKAIIERKYEKKVNNLYLVVLHPDNDNYKVYGLPNLQDEVLSLFAKRI